MSKPSLIYLAGPYSHGNPVVREARYQSAVNVTGGIFHRGLYAFSPIVHCHPLPNKRSTAYSTWKVYCEMMIERSDAFWILMLLGWDVSVGLLAERNFAEHLNKPVQYIHESDWLT